MHTQRDLAGEQAGAQGAQGGVRAAIGAPARDDDRDEDAEPGDQPGHAEVHRDLQEKVVGMRNAGRGDDQRIEHFSHLLERPHADAGEGEVLYHVPRARPDLDAIVEAVECVRNGE
jgi:hypothetical protein